MTTMTVADGSTRCGVSPFTQGEDTDSAAFDAVARLKAIARKPLPTEPPASEIRVLYISLYCYKSFPVRIFHALSLKAGVNSHAVFFKNNFTNDHLPVTETELQLLREVIRDVNPHVVMMSVLAPYVPPARRVVAAVREVCDAPVVLGGKFPTISPEEALSFADYACKGEGEIVLLRIFERLRAGRDLCGIKGLWYNDDAGAVIDMGQEHLYQELDDIPYPAIGEYQMYFIEQNNLSRRDSELDDEEMLMMAGRGCVYLCSFCVNSLLIPMNRGNGRFVRLRSPENILEEISYRRAKCRRVRRICFNDEVFGVFDDWVDDFSKKYKTDCDLPFECELVPKLIKEHNVRRLADAGMFSLHFGIQSGHDEIRRDIMHRPGTNAELVEKAALLQRYGIDPQFDIILDNPFDNAEALEAAIDFLLQLPRPINLNTYKMQYFPRYPFTEMALKAGHVRPQDVTYEAVSESVLYNMVYRPKFPAWNRRNYLENCIYLLSFNSQVLDRLVAKLRRRHNPVLGLVVTLLAQIRYRYAFERRMGLVWGRRFYLGLRLAFTGDFHALLTRVATVIRTPRVKVARTGRLSTRA